MRKSIALLVVLILLLIPLLSAEERDREMGIALVAIGEVDRNVMDWLKDNLSKLFNQQVVVGKAMPEPDYSFDQKRKQYFSTAILREMVKQRDYTSYEKALGVVDHDLFVPELNFVFGEASPKAGVISITRLRQTFYGRPESQELFHRRVLTEAVHELGHTYGLGHCENPICVMFFSKSLPDTDRKGPQFCSRCKKTLRSSIPGLK